MKRSIYAPTDIDQILLDIARVEIDPERGVDVQERMAQGVDFDALLDAASWHGLESLLYRHLRDLGVPVPEALMEGLHARYLGTARRNLYLTSELARLLETLAAAGIRAMPFKGPVAAAHYGNPALRAFGDVDVVVDRADIRAAIRILEERNFSPWADDIEVALRDPAEYGLPFERAEGRVCVDLHWGFAWGWFGRTLEFDALWDRRETLMLAGTSAHVFSSADQLLHMGMHGSKHGPVPWAKLKWISDMAELMRSRPDEVFEELPARAEAVGAGGILAFSTALVRDLLRAPVPPVLARHLDENPRVLTQLHWVSQGLWTHGTGDTEVGTEVRFNLALRERRWDRWMYTWRRVTTPSQQDRLALDLPRQLHFLYPFFRLGRLGVRYADPRRLVRVLKDL